MPEALRQSDAVKRSRAEHPHETLNSTGRERSKKRRLSRESGLASQTAPVSREDSSANRAVSTAVETTQSGELDKASRNSQLPWSLLQVVGGRYSELDPIFSVDEK